MEETFSATRFVYAWHRVSLLLLGTFVALGATYFAYVSAAGLWFRLVLLATAWLLVVGTIYSSRRLKYVSLRESCLVISGKAGEVHVPVGEVERVVQTWFVNPSIVRLVLRKPHPSLGGQVLFIPKDPTPFPPWSASDLVRRLRQVCADGASTVSCRH